MVWLVRVDGGVGLVLMTVVWRVFLGFLVARWLDCWGVKEACFLPMGGNFYGVEID